MARTCPGGWSLVWGCCAVRGWEIPLPTGSLQKEGVFGDTQECLWGHTSTPGLVGGPLGGLGRMMWGREPQVGGQQWGTLGAAVMGTEGCPCPCLPP